MESYSSQRGYPSFTELFLRPEGCSVPLYLELLGPSPGQGSELALHSIREAIDKSPNAGVEIAALFDEVNWRPQLVGAVAMVVGAVDGKTLPALWDALDSESWVSPQLAATAFLTDPDFEANARTRVEAGCPIKRDRLAALDWATRHSAAGPESFAGHASKALAALIYFSRQLPSASTWLDAALASDAIRNAHENDRDGGGRIAARWLENLRLVLGEGS
jgi:hypothetical protein